MPEIKKVLREGTLIIPVGLEKLVAGEVLDMTHKMREPVESLNTIPSMFFITGTIVTEIEALNILSRSYCISGGSRRHRRCRRCGLSYCKRNERAGRKCPETG